MTRRPRRPRASVSGYPRVATVTPGTISRTLPITNTGLRRAQGSNRRHSFRLRNDVTANRLNAVGMQSDAVGFGPDALSADVLPSNSKAACKRQRRSLHSYWRERGCPASVPSGPLPSRRPRVRLGEAAALHSDRIAIATTPAPRVRTLAGDELAGERQLLVAPDSGSVAARIDDRPRRHLVRGPRWLSCWATSSGGQCHGVKGFETTPPSVFSPRVSKVTATRDACSC